MIKRKGRKDRWWQDGETGRVCISWYKPSPRWYAITQKQYNEHVGQFNKKVVLSKFNPYDLNEVAEVDNIIKRLLND